MIGGMHQLPSWSPYDSVIMRPSQCSGRMFLAKQKRLSLLSGNWWIHEYVDCDFETHRLAIIYLLQHLKRFLRRYDTLLFCSCGIVRNTRGDGLYRGENLIKTLPCFQRLFYAIVYLSVPLIISSTAERLFDCNASMNLRISSVACWTKTDSLDTAVAFFITSFMEADIWVMDDATGILEYLISFKSRLECYMTCEKILRILFCMIFRFQC